MDVHYQNGLKYFTFQCFSGNDVEHAIFTRQGGISEGVYRSLNLGGTSGDEPDAVMENHQRVFKAINRKFESRYDVWQVHGNRIICTEHARPENEKHIPADGIFTNKPDVTLMMRFADCVPLLFHDPVKKVIGIVHAGWQGTLLKIGAEAVKVVSERYGCLAEDLTVAIGPSICRECYQIGHTVAEKFETEFGESPNEFLVRDQSGFHLDLWKANEIILRKTGIRNIEISNICTAHNLDDWYSHRAENGKTGRFGVLMGLPKG
jgi:hypothetical protein